MWWRGEIACLEKGRKLWTEQCTGIGAWRVYHFAFFTRSDACALRCIGLCVAGWRPPDNDCFFLCVTGISFFAFFWPPMQGGAACFQKSGIVGGGCSLRRQSRSRCFLTGLHTALGTLTGIIYWGFFLLLDCLELPLFPDRRCGAMGGADWQLA